MTDTPLPRRKEFRAPVKAFVNLSGFDKPSNEIASTIDISYHGAKVRTSRSWLPNQQVSIRSIRGTLDSRARVVHCQPYAENTFVIGIELCSPTSDWTAAEHSPGCGKSGSLRGNADNFRAQLVFISEVLHELFDLLEQYAPMWYTAENHNRAVAALSILRSTCKKYRRSEDLS